MKLEARPVGALLREWRQRRGLSQLDLALASGVSTRHLSFVERGRAKPGTALLGRLADRLGMPLRARNVLFASAGYAPPHPERPPGDPDLAATLAMVGRILDGHAPHPSVAVDAHWTLLAANRPATRLMAGVSPALLAPPCNVLRLTFHPDGLAPRLLNPREWRAHVLARLDREIDATGDPVLLALHEELRGYRVEPRGRAAPAPNPVALALPFELQSEHGRLRLLGTTTVFGTAVDLTLAGIAIESFLPADEATAAALRALDAAP